MSSKPTLPKPVDLEHIRFEFVPMHEREIKTKAFRIVDEETEKAINIVDFGIFYDDLAELFSTGYHYDMWESQELGKEALLASAGSERE